MKQRNWTNEQLIDAVQNSLTYKEVAQKLQLINAGGSAYITIKKLIQELNLDTSHFKKQGFRRKSYKYPLEYYLEGANVSAPRDIKQQLFDKGLKEKRCEMCNNTDWLDQPIPLELHHINGNKFDNRLENLQILCLNCHSTTHNYRSKNIKTYKEGKQTICSECNKPCWKNSSGLCIQCYNIFRRKVPRPPYEILLDLLKTSSKTQIGKIYGVSGRSITNWIRQYELSK